MTDRDQIIEAMAEAIRRERERPAIRSLEWSQKAPERMATSALDAALPPILEALAEKVRAEAKSTMDSAGEHTSDGGMGMYMLGANHAARLVEEVEL